VLDASLPAPKPENWSTLRRFVPSHPPPDDLEFIIPEPARWTVKMLAPVYGKILTALRHRHFKGVALKLYVRYGALADVKRSTHAVLFEAHDEGEGVSQYSEAFATSDTIPKARAHVGDFLQKAMGDRPSSVVSLGWIYRVGVALLYKVRPYRKITKRRKTLAKGKHRAKKTTRARKKRHRGGSRL
jgi:hypothetical protein